jgi:hypothetical protein
MNWHEYIEEGQYDYDWSDDTFDIARQAYVAGLENALALVLLLRAENRNLDTYIVSELAKLIEESK